MIPQKVLTDSVHWSSHQVLVMVLGTTGKGMTSPCMTFSERHLPVYVLSYIAYILTSNQSLNTHLKHTSLHFHYASGKNSYSWHLIGYQMAREGNQLVSLSIHSLTTSVISCTIWKCSSPYMLCPHVVSLQTLGMYNVCNQPNGCKLPGRCHLWTLQYLKRLSCTPKHA